MSIFNKLKNSLSKTKNSVGVAVDNVLRAFSRVDEELFGELEEALISSDAGVNTSVEIAERLRVCAKEKKITGSGELKAELKEILREIMEGDTSVNVSGKPAVIMLIGVNGVGKTTTVGKIAHMYKSQGKKVLVAAADTFRAAAVQQLETWTDRAGVDIIKQNEGSDPAAVVYDAVNAAKARNADILIIDTAGRLHNKKNLMDELAKIFRIIKQQLPESSVETLLVLDATTGQNAVRQAEEFGGAGEITGIVLTKLDGTAKGGIVISIKNDYGISVKLAGVGEGIEDICEFDGNEFIDGIL